MDRFWFLTWTTYGTWLPGDVRGFVSPVWDDECDRLVIHNELNTPYDASMPKLTKESRARLRGSPVLLNAAQAACVAEQFVETACFRGWRLFAYAVMRNHIHVLLGAPGDPEPEHLLRDLKAYASRRLNQRWPRPESGTWWTESSSKRKVRANEVDVARVARYIQDQPHALLMWIWLREDS